MFGFSYVMWVIGIICAIWVIYDVFTVQSKMNSTQKIIWLVCAILFSVITAIVYYFVVKKK